MVLCFCADDCGGKATTAGGWKPGLGCGVSGGKVVEGYVA